MSEFLKQFWEFLKVRKKWWLGPIVAALLLAVMACRGALVRTR